MGTDICVCVIPIVAIVASTVILRRGVALLITLNAVLAVANLFVSRCHPGGGVGWRNGRVHPERRRPGTCFCLFYVWWLVGIYTAYSDSLPLAVSDIVSEGGHSSLVSLQAEFTKGGSATNTNAVTAPMFFSTRTVTRDLMMLVLVAYKGVYRSRRARGGDSRRPHSERGKVSSGSSDEVLNLSFFECKLSL